MSLVIVLTNKSNLAPISDYNYQVLIGDGTPDGSVTLAHGEVKAHTRLDGWQVLVQRLLDQEP